MKIVTTLALFAFVVGLSSADDRQKRQAAYEAYGGNYGGAAQYRQPQPQHQQAQAYHPQQQAQHYPAQPAQHYPAQQARPAPSRQHAVAPDEEEKEQGPHPLQLLLEKSKFECGAKGDGYYADSDVGCQAFHYCVAGQKHSMMCPAGTVFHQVHLNCVPSDQDICSNSNKFYFVNDYLNKPLEQKGPNNTVQYHQRYYPENYAVGDPFIPPTQEGHQGGHQGSHQGGHREPPAATYGLGPAYREQQPAPAAYQQAAHRPQQPAHRPQPAAYAPPQPQAYAPQPRPTYQQQQQHAYQASQASQAQPISYGYQQQQAHQAQALQAQRAYAQQQHQAVAPQQHLYAQQAPRQRYA